VGSRPQRRGGHQSFPNVVTFSKRKGSQNRTRGEELPSGCAVIKYKAGARLRRGAQKRREQDRRLRRGGKENHVHQPAEVPG